VHHSSGPPLQSITRSAPSLVKPWKFWIEPDPTDAWRTSQLGFDRLPPLPVVLRIWCTTGLTFHFWLTISVGPHLLHLGDGIDRDHENISDIVNRLGHPGATIRTCTRYEIPGAIFATLDLVLNALHLPLLSALETVSVHPITPLVSDTISSNAGSRIDPS
jgi:hypothetical protein